MRLLRAIVVGAIALATAPTALNAVPVVPNFTQGSMTSHTETTSTVSETINSMDYNTGYQYSVSGVNVSTDSSSITPGTGTESVTNNGVNSTWTNLNTSEKPNWTLTTPGAAFQFTETYKAPGLSTHTVIQRTTTIQSVTDTTSIFSQ
tara:strand:+ start:4788 stop:5231 length:444 start_codon:yes stop_codon:yes gene_type:complete